MHPAAARIFIAAASAAAAQLSKDAVAQKPSKANHITKMSNRKGETVLPDGTRLRITVMNGGAE